MLNHYLYRHIRLDKNEPFYIGIGSKRVNRNFASETTEYERAYSKCRRNDIWKYIVSKTQYKVEILLDNLSLDEVKQKELEFMYIYGFMKDKTGILSNICTTNTEYRFGYKLNYKRRSLNNYWEGKKRSEETKNKLKIINNGIKNEHSKKKVLCHETNIIYDSITSAAKIHGCNPNSISKACKGVIKKANGFSFSYVDKNNILKIPKRKFRKVMSVTKGKIYESVLEASIENNACYSSILDCCNFKQKSVKTNSGKQTFKYC